ncbi:MAG: YqgE/AlgH family protein [Phenylobacterium sp.]|uniref:YqgE/AlgH family protein n=1 Tax=Phenylobacterium sp. TaxID=1871053 RepID=UPI001A3CD8C8|nr:YqgE/AlgH family protein [Phenylobacterium sp.]MBL8553085.1 YqgE/AlgH family protein [Phenylobacterium sp.]
MEGAFLNGQMLIAMPGIGDPRFERSLILVCAHDADHAMGIAVNRPLDGLTVPDLMQRLEIGVTAELGDDLVLMGGPVEIERGFVLHTDDYHAEHSLDVEGGLALTATREVLEAMGSHNRQPRRAILALGYAGWGAGQLENELRHNVWLTCPADEDLVFDDDYGSKWTRALAKLRIDPKFLSAEGGRA